MSKYVSFRDMIDGGGAGKSGDTFQGGGFLSELGNQFFKPAGYHKQIELQGFEIYYNNMNNNSSILPIWRTSNDYSNYHWTNL